MERLLAKEENVLDKEEVFLIGTILRMLAATLPTS